MDHSNPRPSPVGSVPTAFRWVPELPHMAVRGIHAPWEVSPADLASCGVTVGQTYPFPIVDHPKARKRALATYRAALSAPQGLDKPGMTQGVSGVSTPG